MADQNKNTDPQNVGTVDDLPEFDTFKEGSVDDLPTLDVLKKKPSSNGVVTPTDDPARSSESDSQSQTPTGGIDPNSPLANLEPVDAHFIKGDELYSYLPDHDDHSQDQLNKLKPVDSSTGKPTSVLQPEDVFGGDFFRSDKQEIKKHKHEQKVIAVDQARAQGLAAITGSDDAISPDQVNTLIEKYPEIQTDNKQVALTYLDQTNPEKAKLTRDRMLNDERFFQVGRSGISPSSELESLGLSVKVQRDSEQVDGLTRQLPANYRMQIEDQIKILESHQANIQDGKYTGSEEEFAEYQLATQKLNEITQNPAYQELGKAQANLQASIREYQGSNEVLITEGLAIQKERLQEQADAAYQNSSFFGKRWKNIKDIYTQASLGLVETVVGDLPKMATKSTKIALGMMGIPESYIKTDSWDRSDTWNSIVEDFVTSYDVKYPTPTPLKRRLMEDVAIIGPNQIVLGSDGVPTGQVLNEFGYPVEKESAERVLSEYDADPTLAQETTVINKGAGLYQSAKVGADMMAVLMPIAGTTGAAVKALGASEKVSAGIGVFSGIMMQSMDDFYNSAKEHGATEKEAMLYAFTQSSAIGAIAMVNPLEAKVVQSALRTGTSKAAVNKYVEKMLAAGKNPATYQASTKEALTNGVKFLFKEANKEGLEEMAELPAESVINAGWKSMEGVAITTEHDMKDYIENYVLAAIGSAPFGVANIRQSSSLHKEMKYMSLSNLEETNAIIDSQVGKEVYDRSTRKKIVMTEERAKQMKEDMAVLSNKVRPYINNSDLSEEVRIAAVDLVSQKDAIKREIKGADEVAVKKAKERIDEIDQQLEMILGIPEGQPAYKVDGTYITTDQLQEKLKDPTFVESVKTGRTEVVIHNDKDAGQLLSDTINEKPATKTTEEATPEGDQPADTEVRENKEEDESGVQARREPKADTPARNGQEAQVEPKPVDEDNLSKIFHGTTLDAAKEIEATGFDIEKTSDGTIWFTSNRELIDKGEVAASGKGAVISRLIDESKLKLGSWEEQDKYSTGELIRDGYDGLKLESDGEITYQIFHPEKLKLEVSKSEPQDISDILEGAEVQTIGNTDVILRKEDDRTVIESIQTKKEERGKGGAKAAIDQITKEADESDTKLELKVVPQDESVDETRLRSLYEKAGFTAVEGDEQTMVREPKSPTELEFVTHTGEKISGIKLNDALNKVADDHIKTAEAIRSEDEYASHVSEETKDTNLKKGIEYAEKIRAGEKINNLTVAQRVNAELTGETIAILPSKKEPRKGATMTSPAEFTPLSEQSEPIQKAFQALFSSFEFTDDPLKGIDLQTDATGVSIQMRKYDRVGALKDLQAGKQTTRAKILLDLFIQYENEGAIPASEFKGKNKVLIEMPFNEWIEAHQDTELTESEKTLAETIPDALVENEEVITLENLENFTWLFESDEEYNEVKQYLEAQAKHDEESESDQESESSVSPSTIEGATEQAGIDKAIDLLEDLENQLDQFGKESLSMGLPVAIAKAAVKATKAALQAGKAAAEAIQAGLDAAKTWLDGLAPEERTKAEEALRNAINTGDFSSFDLQKEPESETEPETEASEEPLPIGITNAHTAAQREAAGRDKIAKEYRATNEEVWDQVVEDINNLALDPAEFSRNVANSAEPVLSARNEAILLYDRIRITNEMELNHKMFNQAREKGDVQATLNITARLSELEMEMHINEVAAKKTGEVWGRTGQFRQRLAQRDFSLASIMRQAKAISKSEEIDPEFRHKFEQLTDKYKELQGEMSQLQKRIEQEKKLREQDEETIRKRLGEEVIEGHKKAIAKAGTRTRKKRRVAKKSSARKAATRLTDAEKARKKELKNKFAAFNDITRIATLMADPEFYEYSKLLFKETSGDFKTWAGELIDLIGEEIKEFLPELYKKLGGSESDILSDKDLDQQLVQEELEAIVEDVIDRAEGVLHEGLKGPITRLTRALVEQGANTIDEVVDQAYDLLKDDIEKLDRSELRDLISGYGQFKKLSKEEIDVKIREIKRQGRLDASLEAVRDKNELPIRSGVERDKPSQEAREKQAEILRLIKEKGLEPEPTQAELDAQWRSSMDAYHTRLENAIQDVEKEIEAGQKRAKSKNKEYNDEKSVELREELDRLKTIRDEMFAPPKLTPEEKQVQRLQEQLQSLLDGNIPETRKKSVDSPEVIALKEQIKDAKQALGLLPIPKSLDERRADTAIRATQKQITALEMAIRNLEDGKSTKGEVWPEKKEPPKKIVNAQLDALREQRDALRQERDNLIPEEITDKVKIEKYRKIQQRRLADLQERLDNKDFAPKEKKQLPPLDNELKELNKQIDRVKYEIEKEMEVLRLDQRSTLRRNLDLTLDAWNLFKGMMASVDFSAPFRQGVFLIGKPKIFGRAMIEMFQQAFSEERHTEWLEDLKQTDEFYDMKRHGLYISEPTSKLSAKEEAYMSNLLVWIEKNVPYYGPILRGSERAYIGFLNKQRADVYLDYKQQLEQSGITGEELDTEMEHLSTFINNATGRGKLEVSVLGRKLSVEPIAPILNGVFFSPRLITSRFTLLNPVYYAKMSPEARKLALAAAVKFFASGISLLAMMDAAGDDDDPNALQVEWDPRTTDFLKIRHGNTRYDIWGGMQQVIRMLAQVSSGTKVTSTGRKIDLDDPKEYESRLKVMSRFFTNKFSPSMSLTRGALTNFKDKRRFDPGYNPWMELPRLIVPLSGQQMWEMYFDEEVSAIEKTIGGLMSIFGFGVQSYEAKAQTALGRQKDLETKTQTDKRKAIESTMHSLTENVTQTDIPVFEVNVTTEERDALTKLETDHGMTTDEVDKEYLKAVNSITLGEKYTNLNKANSVQQMVETIWDDEINLYMKKAVIAYHKGNTELYEKEVERYNLIKDKSGPKLDEKEFGNGVFAKLTERYHQQYETN